MSASEFRKILKMFWHELVKRAETMPLYAIAAIYFTKFGFHAEVFSLMLGGAYATEAHISFKRNGGKDE
ncbi:hypothetical protein [Nocardia sp. IFM 10818]